MVPIVQDHGTFFAAFRAGYFRELCNPPGLERFESIMTAADSGSNASPVPDPAAPVAMKLKKSESLTIHWSDGRETVYPLRHLRRMCPCAGCQGERDLLGRTLLPVISTTYDGPITALGAELVGNYAIRIIWSDSHSSGIYSFRYLRQIEPLPGK